MAAAKGLSGKGNADCVAFIHWPLLSHTELYNLYTKLTSFKPRHHRSQCHEDVHF